MPRHRERIIYDPGADYYQLIGAPASATPEELQRAYRRRAKEIHPDTNPDRREWATAAFRELAEAYRVLSDPELRSWYDDLRRSYHAFGYATTFRRRPPARYQVAEAPPFSDAWFRQQLRTLWKWRLFAFWSVVGVVGLFWLLQWALTPPPAPPPTIEDLAEMSGCEAGWRITYLVLEIDPAANVPRTLQVNGAAAAEFTIALYQDIEADPLVTSPRRAPVMPGGDDENMPVLARFDIPTQRNIAYAVLLQATDGARAACHVTFYIS
ncbi:MAG: J domain-containing protein [Anaerolineae bacterium]|nr:J domain-containing protein [Anaerolineae bacterium]